MNAANIFIDRATLGDLDLVVPLFDAYRRFYDQPSNPIAIRDFLSQRFQNEQSVMFIAKNDNCGAGFTHLYPSYSSVSLKPVWILNDLFVSLEVRRQGIGKKLLQTAAQFAAKEGSIRLSLVTGVHNKSAQSLYENNGWKKDNQYHQYFFDL